MKKLTSFLLAVPVILLFSCEKIHDSSIFFIESEEQGPGEIMVDTSNPWFADLSYYFDPGSANTKSSESSFGALETLLDRNREVTVKLGDRYIKETPFLSNSDPQYFCLSENLGVTEVPADSILLSKKFLIESSKGQSVMSYVVTVLAKYRWCEKWGYDILSYTNHPDFSGFIIFSDTNCFYNYISYYDGGELYYCKVMSPGDSSSSKKQLRPVTILKTKSIDVPVILPGVVHIEDAYRTVVVDITMRNYQGPPKNDDEPDPIGLTLSPRPLERESAIGR